MATASVRRLTAILFTDIVGSSLVTGADEDAGLRMRDRHRALVRENVERFGGHLIEAPGDETLSTFESALDAVNAALAIRAGVEHEPGLSLYTGIHLAEVLFRGAEVFGDGINIAARIRAASAPGEILASGEVAYAIRNRPEIEVEARGEQPLKNVDRPVAVFAICGRPQAPLHAAAGVYAGTEVAPAVRRDPRRAVWPLLIVLAFAAVGLGAWWWLPARGGDAPAPGVAEPNTHQSPMTEPPMTAARSGVLRNSIAVLPFTNLSPDPKDAYFAAGIHEEIVNQLAKIRDLSVIARTTMLRYADSGLSIPEIGAELKVTAVMEGSVRYAGKRVRITAQLIDAASGAQLWSEAYEEDLTDIFGIQVAIAEGIADSLQAELLPEESTRIGKRTTESPEAYAHYLRALAAWGNLAGTATAREALDAAITADPGFAAAYAYKAEIASLTASFGPLFFGKRFRPEDQKRLVEESRQLVRRALELGGDDARAQLALADLAKHDRRWRDQLIAANRAYALDPSNPVAATLLGWGVYVTNGDADAANRLLQRGLELNPTDAAAIWNYANFFYLAQRWEAAHAQATLATAMLPDAALGHAQLALTSSRLGDSVGVRSHAAAALERDPGPWELQAVARAFGQIDDIAAARRVFELARAGDESANPDFGWQFWMHMAVRDYDAAVRYLQLAIDTNFSFMWMVDWHFFHDHPDFDAIRARPGFQKAMETLARPLGQAPEEHWSQTTAAAGPDSS